MLDRGHPRGQASDGSIGIFALTDKLAQANSIVFGPEGDGIDDLSLT